MTKDQNYAEDQAKAQLSSLQELVLNLALAKEGDDQDAAEQAILEDPLEVSKETNYSILLCTGGPAVRIYGRLDEDHQPSSAELQYQTWGTPWTAFATSSDEDDALLSYANHFYFDGAE